MCIFFLRNNGSYQLVSYASLKVAVWKVYTLNFVPSPFGRRDIRDFDPHSSYWEQSVFLSARYQQQCAQKKETKIRSGCECNNL